MPDDVRCPNCGKRIRTYDLRSWRVSEQTHTEPAEYDDGCIHCCHDNGCINCCPKEER